ncbi:MAG: phosphoribosylformylglycinamidine synthase subunit PurQ [Geminicoccaceae bacterium]
MRAAVVTFPGSNCDRDLSVAFKAVFGTEPLRVWHAETELPKLDLIGIPGGFSFGDYLRCGAIAARSPVMHEVVRRAKAGVHVLGVCNGFQILTEAGLLPGALVRNAQLKFVCRFVELECATGGSAFTAGYGAGTRLRLPVAHHDGNYVVEPEEMKGLEQEDRIAFRYAEEVNGAAGRIAGVLGKDRNVLGLMPHPERAIEPLLGGSDGRPMFQSLLQALA